MDEKKLVPQGVYLACDKGALPTELTVINHSEVYLFEEPVATTADMIPMVNIQPFGTCMVTGSACMPVPIMWEGFEDGVFIGEFNPLLEDSVLQCGIGGRIKIYYSLAEAQAACPVPGMSMLQMLGTGLLVVAAVGLVVLSGGAIIAAVGALAAVTTVTGAVLGGIVLAAEVAGLYFGVKALADYSQDGDEEALFKEVALGYLFLGVGKAVEKGFKMWKASRAADEVVEVLEEGSSAGDEAADLMKREAKFNAEGERLMSVRELKAFKKKMNDIGVKVETDLKKKVIKGKQAAAFDNQNGIIYLRKEPTMYQALHESHHAEQWKKLGVEAYNSQSRLQKEQYVYEQLMKNTEILSPSEINHAKAYIYFVRNSYWPPLDPSTGLYILN